MDPWRSKYVLAENGSFKGIQTSPSVYKLGKRSRNPDSLGQGHIAGKRPSQNLNLFVCDDMVCGLLLFPEIVGIGEDFNQGPLTSAPAFFPLSPLGPQWNLPPSYQFSLPFLLDLIDAYFRTLSKGLGCGMST